MTEVSAHRQTLDDAQNMLPVERRAAASLALVYSVRMFGLFIILPVFSLYASDYEGATPMLLGLALGIYGLFQALLQLPFGFLSDRIGRKPVILAGLTLFFLGSVVAACADSIGALIFGRALQGSGAIAAAIMALAADLTREQHRTKMMASLGASIGVAFMVSLVAGPVLVRWLGLSGLFWLTGAAAVLGMLIVQFRVPTPVQARAGKESRASVPQMLQLLRDRQLLRLDAGIFLLHMMVSATFLGVPLSLAASGLAGSGHWQVYLPALLISIAVMVPAVILAEKYGHLRRIFLIAVSGLALAQCLLVAGESRHSTLWLFAAVTVFFSFFNTLEALLPSLVSKLAPVTGRGSAMGVYSASQFLGAFAGGVAGGALYASLGIVGLYYCAAAAALLWLLIARGMRAPQGVTTQLVHVGELSEAAAAELAGRLSALPGVTEAVLVSEEGVAYLRVDRQQFDRSSLSTLGLS
ncbi:MFS transporter [Granulosicoccaceae sp. 1_MG-2023]|nr:MFS transporter [Granulosicoccaceae sp. 1_MG-2023]